MNNKGFAITGILYTIFILFIMVLLSILAGLNTRKDLLEKSIMSFEDDYKILEENKVVDISGYNNTALVTGKYVFGSSISNGDALICTKYLKKGDSLEESGTYIENFCAGQDLVLESVYEFNKES